MRETTPHPQNDEPGLIFEESSLDFAGGRYGRVSETTLGFTRPDGVRLDKSFMKKKFHKSVRPERAVRHFTEMHQLLREEGFTHLPETCEQIASDTVLVSDLTERDTRFVLAHNRNDRTGILKLDSIDTKSLHILLESLETELLKTMRRNIYIQSDAYFLTVSKEEARQNHITDLRFFIVDVDTSTHDEATRETPEETLMTNLTEASHFLETRLKQFISEKSGNKEKYLKMVEEWEKKTEKKFKNLLRDARRDKKS